MARFVRHRSPWFVLSLMVASCNRCGGTTAGNDAANAVDAAPTSVRATDGATRDEAGIEADGGGERREDDASAFDAAAGDAEGARVTDGGVGASACRLAYGPAEQAFRGPAALVMTAKELRLVTNDSGKPRIFAVPIAAPPAAGAPVVAPPKPSSFIGVRWPSCEVANRFAYCPGSGGVVYRTTLGANDTKAVAKNRPGTRVAAVALGPDHAALATLDMRTTTEGEMLQAFVTLDDGETQRLSEEGAGATTVRLAARGDRAVAVYLDTRTAMVPVHARPLAMHAQDLTLGEDHVIFVGGPPERGLDFVLGAGAGATIAFLPLARETTDFGMASIVVNDPPKDDVPAVWSMYPNGIDPAPIGATARHSDSVLWVARVKPSHREPGAPRVIELGRTDAVGTFTSFGDIASGQHVTDIAMATDSHGAVWILYGDSTVTWLERRVCP